MGCDEAVLINDSALAPGDSYATARALASAIEKSGGADLVFCGRQAADDDMGVVPLGIAELLGLPSTTIALKIDIQNGTVRVNRLVEDGYDVIELPIPSLVSISNEIGVARYPTLKGIMGAGKKPMNTMTLSDLGLSADDVVPRVSLDSLFIPQRESKVEFISADTPADAGVALALRLRQEKLI
jgi:electron transfer flavoprotein beta subunit